MTHIKKNVDLKIAIVFSLLLLTFYSEAQDQSFQLNTTEFALGDSYTDNNTIHFDLNKTTIRHESYAVLDSLAALLRLHDSLVIEIGVHTDSRGSKMLSGRLHTHRAQSIRNYLTEKGIVANRLIAVGYGESQLLISDHEIAQLASKDAKEKAHQTNRRVVFTVVKIVSVEGE